MRNDNHPILRFVIFVASQYHSDNFLLILMMLRIGHDNLMRQSKEFEDAGIDALQDSS